MKSVTVGVEKSIKNVVGRINLKKILINNKMENYTTFIVFTGGFALSLAFSAISKVYDIVCNAEAKRTAKLEETVLENEKKIGELRKKINEQFTELKQNHEAYVQEKSRILDNKLSLVLSKITCTSGNYKTSVGVHEKGLEKLESMEKIIKNSTGKLSAHYSEVLNKYGERKEEREQLDSGINEIEMDE